MLDLTREGAAGDQGRLGEGPTISCHCHGQLLQP